MFAPSGFAANREREGLRLVILTTLTYTGLTAGRKTRTPARKRTKGGAPGTLLEGIVERVKGWKPPPRQHAGRARGFKQDPARASAWLKGGVGNPLSSAPVFSM
jgi:hypothetical protein